MQTHRLLICFGLLTLLTAAQTARVKKLLAEMRSSDPGTRMAGLLGLVRVPHVLTEPGVAQAVIALAREEEANYDADARFIHSEAWADYYGHVTDAVFDYVRLSGDLGPLPLVIDQPSNTGSLEELNVAKLGPPAIPALQQVAADGDKPGREQATDVAGIMLQRNRAGVEPLSPEAQAALRAILMDSLSNKNPWDIRAAAVKQIGRIGDPGDRALLEKLIANHDMPKAAKRALAYFGERSREMVQK